MILAIKSAGSSQPVAQLRRGGIGNTIVGLFVLGVLNNGLDHVNIDSFLKILIRGLILLAALVINVYAQRVAGKELSNQSARGLNDAG